MFISHFQGVKMIFTKFGTITKKHPVFMIEFSKYTPIPLGLSGYRIYEYNPTSGLRYQYSSRRS